MKRLLAVLTALTLLVCAFSVPAYAEEMELALYLNGAEAQDGTDFYQKDGEYMVPLRLLSETLGMAVEWDNGAKKAVVVNPLNKEVSISAKPPAISVDGAESVTIKPAPEIINESLFVPLSQVAGYLACDYEIIDGILNVFPDHYGIAEYAGNSLANGEYEALYSVFSDSLMDELDVETLAYAIEASIAGLGEYQSSIDFMDTWLDEGFLVYAEILYERGVLETQFLLNWASGKIEGISINPVIDTSAGEPEDIPLPKGVTEIDVILGEGTDFPLNAKLTYPTNAKKPVPAVVLVKGSGSSDMDETAYGYKPFRDIAYGLAQQGIAVLRFDSRFFVYGNTLSAEEIASITIKEEYVDDVLAATDFLKAHDAVDSDKVYMIGHSMGGMLATYLDEQGGDFAGIVSLAGTARALWEIVYDQNLAALGILGLDDAVEALGLSEEEFNKIIATLDAEMEKIQALSEMTDEEAKSTEIFGMNAYYLKSLADFDPVELAKNYEKPILVLQGEDDFQVYADVDFALWQELLEGKDNAVLKLYPNLNHFFVEYEGDYKGTVYEYYVPGSVSAEVIKDIANWILALGK